MNQSSVRRLLSFYKALYAVGVVGTGIAATIAIWLGFTRRSWIAFLIAAIFAALLLYVVRSRLMEFRSLKHLAGPKPSFFLGNMRDLLAYGHGGRDRALEVLHGQYGPIVRLHLAWGSAPFVSLSYASSNLQRKELDSHRRADRTMLPRSLMGIEMGERHKTHRQAIFPSLTRRSVADRTDVLREMSVRYVNKWKQADEAYDGLQSDIRDWSVNCLSAFLFGDDWETRADLKPYHRALGAIEEEVSFRAFHPFFVRWIFPRRLIRARVAYHQVAAVLASVMLHRERRIPDSCPVHERPKDLLDQIVHPRAVSGGLPWSSKDRIEELMSLVLGGADPMAYVISQSLVLLSQHPEVQEKARDRIRLSVGESENLSEREQCPAREANGTGPDSFIKDIVYETLRLFPPVPFSAKFVKERAVVEGGNSIPPGTVIMWTKNVVGRNKDVFREAERFNPERFIAGEDGRDSLSSFLPFGAGPRRCVGNRLAEQQCAVLLTEILRNFQIIPVEHLNVEFHSTISVIPSAVPVRLVAI